MNNKFYIQLSEGFSEVECLRFLQRSPFECLFQVENDRIYFPLEIEEIVFLIRVHFKKSRLWVEVLKGKLTPFSKKVIKSYISEWLDIKRDLSDFYKMGKKDPLLKPLIKKNKGLPLIGIPSFLEAISWAIIGQQINLTFAYTLKKRLVEHYGKVILFEGRTFYLFPKATIIAQLTEEDLRPHQFSRSKIKYLTGVAQAIVDGKISKEILSKMSYEEAKNKLVELKGIGNWSADYVLMKCLRHPDAFPITDVGLHNAIKFQLGQKEKPSIEAIEKMAVNWKGWKSYVTFYLWHSLLK